MSKSVKISKLNKSLQFCVSKETDKTLENHPITIMVGHLCRNLWETWRRLVGMALDDSAIRRRKTKVRMRRKKMVEARVIVRPKRTAAGASVELAAGCSSATQATCTGTCQYADSRVLKNN